MAMRIQLCGKVTVERDGRRIEGRFPGRQGVLVFVYLTVNRRRVVPRDELIELLWPDQAPADTAAALSVVVSKLRTALGRGSIEGRSEPRIVLEDAWIDLEAAHEAIHRAEAAVAEEAWTDAWAPARVALHISRRGFLPGYDGAWIAHQRRMIDDLHVRALRCVVESGLGLGPAEHVAAERAARTLVDLAPFHEEGATLLMRSLEARGNVSAALVVYDELRCRLRDELGTTPASHVREIHRRLLAMSAAPGWATRISPDKVAERSD